MSTKLLTLVREQDQAELAARHNAHVRELRQPGRRWVIETMRKRLPPEHVTLAYNLEALQAQSEGRKPADAERVDGAGNGAETSMIARLDAARAIAGYEQAISRTLRRSGVLCFRAILSGATLGETMTLCGYASGSDVSVRRLIQLTMMAAQDYDDACRNEREQNNSYAALDGLRKSQQESATFRIVRPQA